MDAGIGTVNSRSPPAAQVMHGQRIRANGYHPFTDVRPSGEVAEFLGNVEKVVQKCADFMPSHADFIRQYCAASS